MPFFQLPIEYGVLPVSNQLHCDVSVLAPAQARGNPRNPKKPQRPREPRATRSRPATSHEPAGLSSATASGSGGADAPGSGAAGRSAGTGEETAGDGEDPEDGAPEDGAPPDRLDEVAEDVEEEIKSGLQVIFLIKTDHPGQDFTQGDSYYLAVPYRAAHEAICPRPWTSHLDSVDQSVKKALVDDKEGVRGNTQGHAMHQSLATALHVAEMSQRGEVKFDVEIKSYDSSGRQTLDELKRKYLFGPNAQQQQQQETILVIMHTGTPVVETTPEPWRALPRDELSNLRLYPCETEMLSENGKIDDVVAFDAVAARRAKWRPQTCFGIHHVFDHGVPRCPLEGQDRTVYKRSWSDANQHVGVKRRRTSPLTCLPLPDIPTKTPSRRQSRVRRRQTIPEDSGDEEAADNNNNNNEGVDDDDDGVGSKKLKLVARDHNVPRGNRPQTRWFHQEFVPSLQHGEFRVFVATTPDALALRGRRGYVVHWVVTATNSDVPECGDAMLVWRPDVGGSSSSGSDDAKADADLAGMDGRDPFASRGTTQKAVLAFALEAFEALRRDGGPTFESLEVGCRVDVGVCAPAPQPAGEDGEGEGEAKLFVNEINRWYSATYFSIEALPAPHSKICAHFARAFANWIRSGGHRRDLGEGPSALEG